MHIKNKAIDRWQVDSGWQKHDPPHPVNSPSDLFGFFID
jgi:hypothetical protein